MSNDITLFPPRLLEPLHLFARTGTLNLPCFNLCSLLDFVLEGFNYPFQGLLHARKAAFLRHVLDTQPPAEGFILKCDGLEDSEDRGCDK